MMETNYLVHHGVKGQQWGVRRYQNPDGSLTDLGKRRIAKEANKLSPADGPKIFISSKTRKTRAAGRKLRDEYDKTGDLKLVDKYLKLYGNVAARRVNKKIKYSPDVKKAIKKSLMYYEASPIKYKGTPYGYKPRLL